MSGTARNCPDQLTGLLIEHIDRASILGRIVVIVVGDEKQSVACGSINSERAGGPGIVGIVDRVGDERASGVVDENEFRIEQQRLAFGEAAIAYLLMTGDFHEAPATRRRRIQMAADGGIFRRPEGYHSTCCRRGRGSRRKARRAVGKDLPGGRVLTRTADEDRAATVQPICREGRGGKLDRLAIDRNGAAVAGGAVNQQRTRGKEIRSGIDSNTAATGTPGRIDRRSGHSKESLVRIYGHRSAVTDISGRLNITVKMNGTAIDTRCPALVAGNIKQSADGHKIRIGEDGAAICFRACRRRLFACADGFLHRYRTARRGQENAATARCDTGRVDRAVIVAGQRVDVAAIGAQFNLGGLDMALLGDGGARIADTDKKLAVIKRSIAQQDFPADSQANRAVRCADPAVVDDGFRNHGDIAAKRTDPAQIDDLGIGDPCKGGVATIKEISVRDIKRRGNEASPGLDDTVLAYDHAVFVDEEKRAAGRQRPIDRGNRTAGHPVEGRTRAVVETDRVARPDGKSVPLDYSILTELVDQE